MSALDYMIAAEEKLLLADSQLKPSQPKENAASAHLHTAMAHLEFAIAIARGHTLLPDPEETKTV